MPAIKGEFVPWESDWGGAAGVARGIRLALAASGRASVKIKVALNARPRTWSESGWISGWRGLPQKRGGKCDQLISLVSGGYGCRKQPKRLAPSEDNRCHLMLLNLRSVFALIFSFPIFFLVINVFAQCIRRNPIKRRILCKGMHSLPAQRCPRERWRSCWSLQPPHSHHHPHRHN